ncbi:MAG: Ppx/GppA family phosphatase [Alphaproteobacteria bacterium]|nr:Ppx/GppA family phosphatase [Alphaproteobacteria bacterium]
MSEGRKRGSRRGGRGKDGRRPLVAALDLGTNNCRLLIASAARNGQLRVVDSFSRIVRLGEGVAATGHFSEAAIGRTVAALKMCAQHIGNHPRVRVRAVGTEACRRAANIDLLLARAKEEAGIALEVISPEEEARLAAIGCAPLVDPEAAGSLIFDIGGGSTETIWMKRDGRSALSAVAAISTSVGVVSLAEAAHGVIDRAGYERMRADMISLFAAVKAQMDGKGVFDCPTHHLLGTSGTVTTLAGIALGLARYDRGKVDGSWHDCADIESVIDRLVSLDVPGRAAIGCVGPDRADLIVPGCAIFAAIHHHWPCLQLRVADRGLREGILRELLARH